MWDTRDQTLLTRRSALAALAAAGGLLGCTSSAPRRPADARTVRTSGGGVAGLVEAHNRERARRRLPPLVPGDALNAAARDHAADWAARRRMSHRGGDGSSPFRRIERAGYSYARAGENVAAGQRTTGEVMADWMRSPGHRRNVLGNFSEIGAAYATDRNGTPYWCVTFGTPAAPRSPSRGSSVV